MEEFACERVNSCDPDQTLFKGLFARALGVTVQIAPFTRGAIIPRIRTSAAAAAKVCVVDEDDTDEATCGPKWTAGKRKDLGGISESISALQVIQANLNDVVPPVKPDASPTSSEGGNSPTQATSETATSTPDDSGSFRLGVGWQQSSLAVLGLFLTVFASI